MKICIVTVHKSLNSGSFLQALALEKVLKEKGCDTFFLKSLIPENIIKEIVVAVKKIAKLRINEGIKRIEMILNFGRMQKRMKEINAKDCAKADCIVIGSDAVWNFADAGFKKYKKRFLCSDFDGVRRITYAVSVGYADSSDFNDVAIVKGIRKIDEISVRDNRTKEIVDKITGREAVLVLDPTLLLSRDDFAEIEAKCSDSEYILIYMFERLDKQLEKNLLKLREKTGKKIVSFGGYRAFADINVSNDPFKFLYYFNHADMVVTNTFHGTIFSIINHKPFAEFGGHKKKVSELLSMLDLSGQICENAEDMEKVLNQEIDYDKVDKKLEKLREQSKDYLFNALKG